MIFLPRSLRCKAPGSATATSVAATPSLPLSGLDWVFLILAPLGCGILALALGQDANWDFRNYHWYNAWALVNGRYDRDLLPSQTPFFYNPALDVPFHLLASAVSAKTAAFALGMVQGLNAVLLFLLARRALIIAHPAWRTSAAAGLATLGLLGGGGIAQIGTTFYDNVTSLGFLLSALLVLRFHAFLTEAPFRRAAFRAFLFGLPAGLMMGLKLPGVVFCVGLCGAFFALSAPFSRRFGLAFAFGAGVLAGLAVALGPWAWFLWTRFESPLFPYFNGFFGSPYAPLTSARDVQFLPQNPSEYALFPFLFARNPLEVGEIPWRDFRLPTLYVLLPLALLLRAAGRLTRAPAPEPLATGAATRFLLAAGALSYAVWLFLFAIYRYALPLEMLAPLLILLALGLAPLSLRKRWALGLLILGTIAATVQPGNWSRREAWLERVVEADLPPFPVRPPALLLMAGFEPYAHLATLFPPSWTFVRPQSNFASPQEGKGVNRLLGAKITAHKGPVYLLIPPWQVAMADEALGVFDLTVVPGTCRQGLDRLVNAPFLLCDVARIRNPQPRRDP